MNSHDNNEDLECKKIINKKDYYDILGIEKNASEEEIRKNYKKLAIKFHPDKNKSSLSSDAFKKVSHSFNVLSNKEKRKNYDKYGTEEDMIEASNSRRRQNSEEMDPFDLFNMFFGGMNNMPKGGGRGGTQYVYSNGNGEYKVFASNSGGFNFSSFQSGNCEEENSDEGEYTNFGNDIFNHIFNAQNRNGRNSNQAHNRRGQNNQRKGERGNDSNERARQQEDQQRRRPQHFSFISAILGIAQFFIIFMVIFNVVIPLIFRMIRFV